MAVVQKNKPCRYTGIVASTPKGGNNNNGLRRMQRNVENETLQKLGRLPQTSVVCWRKGWRDRYVSGEDYGLTVNDCGVGSIASRLVFKVLFHT